MLGTVELTPRRVASALIHRVHLLSVVLLAAAACLCAWQGGRAAASEFLPYAPRGGMALGAGGALLALGAGLLLASWRLAKPLAPDHARSRRSLARLTTVLPAIWIAALYYALIGR